MPQPIYDSRTPRFDLPLLFAGQAQKEGFVNESLARLDALVHAAVESELAVPPAAPVDGQSWLVAAGASGEWAGRTGQIAARQAGNWIYAVPRNGLRILNVATGQCINYRNGWQIAARPAVPTGGTNIDSEARTAIAALVNSLTVAGILPAA